MSTNPEATTSQHRSGLMSEYKKYFRLHRMALPAMVMNWMNRDAQINQEDRRERMALSRRVQEQLVNPQESDNVQQLDEMQINLGDTTVHNPPQQRRQPSTIATALTTAAVTLGAIYGLPALSGLGVAKEAVEAGQMVIDNRLPTFTLEGATIIEPEKDVE